MLKFSENIGDISAAIALMQSEVGNTSKNSANPFFKSKYSDLAEVLNVIRPVLSKNGLALTQHPSYADGMCYVTTLLSHSSGQWVQSCVSTPVVKSDPQGVGSSISYCRRYAAAAICGVAQEDDDANAASAKSAAQKNTDAAQSVDLDPAVVATLQGAADLKSLAVAWGIIPVGVRHGYGEIKDAVKAKLSEVK